MGRAINAQVRTGGNILILTYNKTLINYIRYRMGRVRADFLWNKFTIKHYHGFFKEQANNAGLQCGLTSCDQAEFFENTKKPLAKYDAIFVDEVQDYEDAWLTTLHRYFLKDNGEFVVFGDPKQNVYKRNLDASGDISIRIIGGMWNKSLVKSMRCTAPLLANLSVRFQQTFFNESAEHIEWKDSQELDYNNSQLDYFNWGAPRAEDNKKVLVHEVKVAKVNEQLARACVNIIGSQTMENFVVLSDTKETLREVEFCYRKAVDRKTKTTFCTLEQYTALCKEYDYGDWRFDNDVKHIEDFRKKHFTMRSNVLHFSTIESFKGYDADTVIVIIAKEMDEKPNHNLYYTAFTRAKRSLYVFNLNEKNIYGPLFDEIKNRGIRQSSKTQTNMRTPRP